VELLVSMAVLALIILLVSQLTNNAATVVAKSRKHMDMDTEARIIFSRFAIEVGEMVKRSDVDYSEFKQPASTLPARYGVVTVPANLQSGTNDQLAFYAETTGYGNVQLAGAARANVSLVAYEVANDPFTGGPALRHMSQALGWEPGSGNLWKGIAYLPITILQQWGDPFGATYTANFETVGDQVFRIEYTYLLKPTATAPSRLSITPWDTTAVPAHTSINGFADVAAIVLTLGLLDSRSRAIVHSYTNLTSTTLFPDAVEPTADSLYHGDVASAWNAKINTTTFASQANIPQAAARGIEVYECSFSLDTSP